MTSVCVEGGQGHQIDLEEAIVKAKAKVCQACDGFGAPHANPRDSELEAEERRPDDDQQRQNRNLLRVWSASVAG